VGTYLLTGETAGGPWIARDMDGYVNWSQHNVERVVLSVVRVVHHEVFHQQRGVSALIQVECRRRGEQRGKMNWNVFGKFVDAIIDTETEAVDIDVRIIMSVSAQDATSR